MASGRTSTLGEITPESSDCSYQNTQKPDASYAVFARTGDKIDVVVSSGRTAISIPSTESMTINHKVALAKSFVTIGLIEGTYKKDDNNPNQLIFIINSFDQQFRRAVKTQIELLGYICETRGGFDGITDQTKKSDSDNSNFNKVLITLIKQEKHISQKVLDHNKQEMPNAQINNPAEVRKNIVQNLLTIHDPNAAETNRRLVTAAKTNINILDKASAQIGLKITADILTKHLPGYTGDMKAVARNLQAQGECGYNYTKAANDKITELKQNSNFEPLLLAEIGTLKALVAARAAPTA